MHRSSHDLTIRERAFCAFGVLCGGLSLDPMETRNDAASNEQLSCDVQKARCRLTMFMLHSLSEKAGKDDCDGFGVYGC